MKSVITDSVKLKAEAYQYQVERFGKYRPQKPLSKAIANTARTPPAAIRLDPCRDSQ